MKVTGKTGSNLGLEDGSTPKGRSTWALLRMIRLREKASIVRLMELTTMVTGSMTSNMGMVRRYLLEDQNTLANTKMVKRKAQEPSSCRMALDMKER